MRKLPLAIVLSLTLIFPPIFPTIAMAAHGQVPHWVNEAVNAKGKACCSNKDCIPVGPVQFVKVGADFVHVHVEGIFGIIYGHTLLGVPCPREDPRSFICFNPEEESTGAVHPILSPVTLSPKNVRCILVPKCRGENS